MVNPLPHLHLPPTAHSSAGRVSPSFSPFIHPVEEAISPLNGSFSSFTLEDDDEFDALNVIIPIGGIGSRFAANGYRFPKPLINIVGRPMLFWLIDRLALRAKDSLFIAINEMTDEEFHLAMQLQREYPEIDIKVVHLKFDTRGAAETLYIVSQSLSEEQMTRRTISLDCDTIYFDNILSRVRTLPAGCGATVTFDDGGDPPVFSYVETDHRNRIIDIKEKIAISRHANTGAYIFPSGFLLRQHAASFLDQRVDHMALGEYYTSSLIADMMQSGVSFMAIEIPKSAFACVGTPTQLTAFLRTLQQRPEMVKKRRFCFDLDSTLVTPPSKKGDYSTCGPIERNIELVRQLHAAGHHIIINTARRMRTHSGNVGAVIKDVGLVTMQTLKDLDIPHDEIHFGKPWAHIYVDDLAVNALLDTTKEIGWHSLETMPGTPSGEGEAKGMLAPRSFNTVQVVDNVVVKSSVSEAILGEIFFFSRVPEDIKDLFPGILSLDHIIATQSFSITMQRVRGITFSHLLVSRALTPGRWKIFLQALSRMHNSDGITTQTQNLPASLKARFDALQPSESRPIDLYANYYSKVKARYEKHKSFYAILGSDHEVIAKRLLDFLKDFELSQRAIPSKVIHGDPVFSNIIFTESNKIALIDVRGSIGDLFTTEGDAMYDLSKVLQSLQGYDFALLANPKKAAKADLDELIPEADRRLLAELEDYFWAHVRKNYPSVQKTDLLLLTASLLFSLIPLHDPPCRPTFYKMCQRVLSRVGA